MRLKMDKFTWAVVIVVVVLLVSAVVTLSLTGGGAQRSDVEYLPENSPAAAVHNAYVAFLKSDPETARQYYSAAVLEEADRTGTFRNQFGSYYRGNQNQRLRILAVEMRGDNAARVSIAIDRYSPGGLLDGGSIWTDRQTLSLVREDGQWKIDTLIFFY